MPDTTPVEFDSPYLSVREFAALLGVTVRSVYNQLHKIPHIKFGGSYRIHRDVIHLLTHEADPKAPRRWNPAKPDGSEPAPEPVQLDLLADSPAA
jgi:excisionase family DNA binding protein